MKIKHYQHTAARNFLGNLFVSLAPRTPKNKRRTYNQIKQTNERRERDARLLQALKN